MAKKRKFDEFEAMPNGDEAAERWKEFISRLDELNLSICELTELGQMIVMALRENAEQTGNPITGWLNKIVETFSEAKRYYAAQREKMHHE